MKLPYSQVPDHSGNPAERLKPPAAPPGRTPLEPPSLKMEGKRSRLWLLLALAAAAGAAWCLANQHPEDWVRDRAEAHSRLFHKTGFPLEAHPFSTLASPGPYSPSGLWSDLAFARLAQASHPMLLVGLRWTVWMTCFCLAGWLLLSQRMQGLLPWLLACASLFTWQREPFPFGWMLCLLVLTAATWRRSIPRITLSTLMVLLAPYLCRQWPLVWMVAICLSLIHQPGKTAHRSLAALGVLLTPWLFAGLDRSYRALLLTPPWEFRPQWLLEGAAWSGPLRSLSGVSDTLWRGSGAAAWLPWLGCLTTLIFTLDNRQSLRAKTATGLVLVATCLWCLLAPPLAPTLLLVAVCVPSVFSAFRTGPRNDSTNLGYSRHRWTQPAGWLFLGLVLLARWGAPLLAPAWFGIESPESRGWLATRKTFPPTRGKLVVEALRDTPNQPTKPWKVVDGFLAPAWVAGGLGRTDALGPDLEWYGGSLSPWKIESAELAEPAWWRDHQARVVLSHPDESLVPQWLAAATSLIHSQDATATYSLLQMAAGIPVLAQTDPSQMPLAESMVLRALAPRSFAAQNLQGWLDWVENLSRVPVARRRKQVLAFQTAALWGQVVGSQPLSPGTSFPVQAALLSQCLADDPLRVVPGDPISLAALQLAKRAGWAGVAPLRATPHYTGPVLENLGKAMLLELSSESFRKHATGLRLITTLRHVQAVHLLKRAADAGRPGASLALARQFLENGQLDASLACLEQAAKSTPEPSANSPNGTEELRQSLATLRARVGGARADHTLKASEFPENPVRQATLAIEAGLAETALGILEKSPVTLIGAEGVRLELELMALLGRSDSLGRLVEGTIPEDLDGFLGGVTLDGGSGLVTVPAGTWYTTLHLASMGRCAEASAKLDSLTMALETNRSQAAMRSMRAMPRILAWGLGLNLPGSEWSLPLILVELARVRDVEEGGRKLADSMLDLQAAAFYLDLQRPDPAPARERLTRLMGRRTASATHSVQWLAECSLLWLGTNPGGP